MPTKSKRGRPRKQNKVVFIPDTHFPYVNTSVMNRVLDLIAKEQPDYVIQAGDLLDLYSFSRYEKDANLTSPDSELEEGLAMATDMWAAIRKLAPKAKCVQLIGNHEDRLTKTIAKKAPELMSLTKKISDLYNFKGVRVMDSSKNHFELDGVIYTHGHYTKLGDHAKFYRKSVVHGHSHHAGIFYEQTADGLIWEMDTGFLADKSALPLQYTQSSFSKWVTAVGIVENGQPRVVLLE